MIAWYTISGTQHFLNEAQCSVSTLTKHLDQDFIIWQRDIK